LKTELVEMRKGEARQLKTGNRSDEKQEIARGLLSFQKEKETVCHTTI